MNAPLTSAQTALPLNTGSVHPALHALGSHIKRPSVRVLVIPGLHNSGEAHWQTWLQQQYRDSARVTQSRWSEPDLDIWSQRIQETIASYSQHTLWVAVAHSFGCLALAHHLARTMQAASVEDASPGGRIVAALMAAPADPIKFGLAERLPCHELGLPLTVIGSENDPWMPLPRAREWALQWGGGFINLGQVGHINTDSGFGPWPLARQKVDHFVRDTQWRHRRPCAAPDCTDDADFGDTPD